MSTFGPYIAGAEWLILLWIVLILAWAAWTIRIVGQFRMSRARQMLHGEAGLSYTLAFVLTTPIYLLTCLMIGEVTILLVTKIGTVYAAYAGARSAAVWETMDEDLRKERIEQAVVNGLAPFAMSGESEVAGPSGIPSPMTMIHALEYAASLRLYSGTSIKETHVIKHYCKVAQRTKHEIKIPERKHGKDITCEVTYRAPFISPGVGRLLDPDHSYPFEITMTSDVTLTLELPKNKDGTLGIDYRSY